MLPSVVPRLATDSAVRVFPGVWKLLSFLRLPSQDAAPSLPLLSLFVFYIFSYLLSKTMGCFSGCLVSSAGIPKLFCGLYSAFKCSFDEFVGEKVVSPSYSSSILRLPPPIFVFWILSFKPAFSLSSFTFIKRLFSSSSHSTIKVVSSAYLRLLIFLLAILIPSYASSSLAFHVMYSVCKLNKQGDNIQPWRTPFPIWNQSVIPCPALTVASWPAYRFLRRQVRWSEFPISKNFPQFFVIRIVKGFSIVNKAEVDVFLKFLCFFYDPPYACYLSKISVLSDQIVVSGVAAYKLSWDKII